MEAKTPLQELIEALERSHGRRLTPRELAHADAATPKHFRSGPKAYPVDGRLTGREATDY